MVLFEKEIQSGDEEWWDDDKYQIIQCQGCDTISYRTLHNDIQQNQYADYDEPWTQVVYPIRDVESLPLLPLLNTPNNIKKIYRETIDAFNNNLNILCSAGLRSIIEGICVDRDVKDGEITNEKGEKRKSKHLDGKIEGLYSNGYLTKTNANILHELRFLGNEALHELTSPSDEELKIAIGIIEHTVENIYEIQHAAKKLRFEKAKRKDN